MSVLWILSLLLKHALPAAANGYFCPPATGPPKAKSCV